MDKEIIEPIDAPVYKPLDATKVPLEVTTKYQLTNNTLSLEAKADVADKIQVEIGDAKTPEAFMPQVKVMRWSNEVNFSMRHIDDEPGEAVIEYDGEKVMYKKPKIEVHQYDKPEAGEDGGFEFEWVLNEAPATNELKASIKTKGLEFYFQPPLTEEEIAEGAIRPENVVGSYAVYHSTKRDNIVGGKEYKTGKAFHIYRPEAIDAEGNRTWCEINIDTTTELATVTVPQKFLDNAVYPVVVDPTFGYTSAPASAVNRENAISLTGSYTPTMYGVLTSLSAYVYDGDADQAIRTALYLDADVSLVTNSESDIGNNADGTGNHWVTMPVSNTCNITPVGYRIALWTESVAGFPGFRYDTGQTGYSKTQTYSTGAWPSPLTGLSSNANQKYGLYATYTATINVAGYTNCHAITIDNTKVSGTGDLTDFPILIAGTYDGTGSEPDLRVTGSGGDVTSSSGYDIEFSSDSAGNTKLAHDLEKYVSTTGEIYCWVKIPTLDGDADTTIYMWFGNSNVTASTEQVTSVWNSGYKAVYHMDEASGNAVDSSSNAVNLTVTGTPSRQVAGISGGYGVDIEADSTQFFSRDNIASLSTAAGVTMEAWGKLESTATNRMIFFHGDLGYIFLRVDNTDIKALAVPTTGGSKTVTYSGGATTATWYHLVARYVKNDKLYLYVNGVERGTAVSVGDYYLTDDTPAAVVGAYASDTQEWDGVIDEVRLSNVDRGADWIITTYNTIGSPSTFYSVGTTNLVGGGPAPSTWIPKVIFM